MQLGAEVPSEGYAAWRALMMSTILHAKVPAPGEQACRSGSLSTQVLPENNFATEKVRVRRGGPDWSARGWRELPAEVRRRPRRSSLPQKFGLPRRFVFTVEVIRRWPRSLACASRGGSPAATKVQLAVELRLAEEVRVRRGSPARPGGCCRRPRRSSLTQRFLSADV